MCCSIECFWIDVPDQRSSEKMISIRKRQLTLRTLMIYAVVGLLLVQPVDNHNIHRPHVVSEIHKIRHQQWRNTGRNNDTENQNSNDLNINMFPENSGENNQYNQSIIEKFNVFDTPHFETAQKLTSNLSLGENNTSKPREEDYDIDENVAHNIDVVNRDEAFLERQQAMRNVADLKTENRSRSISTIPLRILEQYEEYLIENKQVQQSLDQNCHTNDCVLDEPDIGWDDIPASSPRELLLSEDNYYLSAFTTSSFDQGVTIEYSQPTPESTAHKGQSKDDAKLIRHKRDSDETLQRSHRSKLQLIALQSVDFNRHRLLLDEIKNNRTIKGPTYLSSLFDVVHHRSRRGTRQQYNKSCYKNIANFLKTPLDCFEGGTDGEDADLNVVVNEWIGRFQSLCHGQLDIHVTKRKGYPKVALRIFRIEIILTASENAVEKKKNKIDKSQRLAVESVAPETDNVHQKANHFRSADPDPTKSKHRRATAGWVSSPNKMRRKATLKRDNYCRRRPLYIDFEHIGQDWILEPPGYNAYYCAGDCPMTLPAHFNGTNHAVIQSLLNSVNKQVVPGPCCVPVALSPIPMIYLDADGVAAVRNYKNMVVEACGCR